MNQEKTHIGLFEGIGGFSLSANQMDWNTIAWCEINPFCQKILQHYWPEAKEHYDIKETDFTIYKGKCFILTGGFPCQPYSQAGKRLGKEDDRHLWPEMLRAVREIQPRWVVGENVRGLVNWNGGMVFDEVQADLEAEGYEVQTFILPACAKNAPHRRDRVWIVAYRKDGNAINEKSESGGKYRDKGIGREKVRGITRNIGMEQITSNSDSDGHKLRRFKENRYSEEKSESQQNKRQRVRGNAWGTSEQGDVTDSNSRRQPSEEHRKTESRRIAKEGFYNKWENFPTQPPICSGDDGLSSRLAGITFPKFRNESIKAYGNAIVPQISFEIFKAIEQYENEL